MDNYSGFIGDETEKNLPKLKTEEVNSHAHCCPTVKKKARHNTRSQLTLRSFFQQSNSIASHRGCADTNTSSSSPGLLDAGMNKDNSSQTTEVVDRYPTGNAEDGACEVSESGIDTLVENQSDISGNLSFEKEKANIAALEWQRIQQKMKMSIPLCKGHKEPCVARCVKKEGPNIGRRFYVCARATVFYFEILCNIWIYFKFSIIALFNWSILVFFLILSIFFSCWSVVYY